MEHTFGSIINILRGMLNNWSELGCLSAQQSFACSWWICGIQFTLQGERGNIVLSCVSVFIAHSLINYSAEPSDCDLQFWEKAQVFTSKDESVTSLIVLCSSQHVFIKFRLKKITKHSNVPLKCSCVVQLLWLQMQQNLVFHPFKRVKLATQGNFILFSLLCLCGEWLGSVRVCPWAHTRIFKECGGFRELGGFPDWV